MWTHLGAEFALQINDRVGSNLGRGRRKDNGQSRKREGIWTARAPTMGDRHRRIKAHGKNKQTEKNENEMTNTRISREINYAKKDSKALKRTNQKNTLFFYDLSKTTYLFTHLIVTNPGLTYSTYAPTKVTSIIL
ncbi:hypothetical protein GQR58_030483 [Nymphon striatum]|nr:hypothetical protein GQR58_030483 [Nymphon striatum]